MCGGGDLDQGCDASDCLFSSTLCAPRAQTTPHSPPGAAPPSQGLVAILGPAMALAAVYFAWRSGGLGLMLRITSALLSSCSRGSSAAPLQQQQQQQQQQAQVAAASEGQLQHKRGKQQGRPAEPAPAAGREGEDAVVVVGPRQQQQQDGVAGTQKQLGVVGVPHPLPSATEPPPAWGQHGRVRRRSSSLLAQMRASVAVAAQQARDAVLGWRYNQPAYGGAGLDSAGAASQLALPTRLPPAPAQPLQPLHSASPAVGLGSGWPGPPPSSPRPPFSSLPAAASPASMPALRSMHAPAMPPGGGGGGSRSDAVAALQQQLLQMQQQRRQLQGMLQQGQHH